MNSPSADKRIAQRVQILYNSITDSDLNRDRSQDFKELSLLTSHFANQPNPIDYAHKFITSIYVNYIKRVETAASFKSFARFTLLLSRVLSGIKLDALAQEWIPFQRNLNTTTFSFFIIDTDAWLGHLKILISFIASCSVEQRSKIAVIAFSGTLDSKFGRALSTLGTQYICLPSQTVDLKIANLRSLVGLQCINGCKCRLIWVTWPPLVFLGGLSRIAPVQLAWSMKYPHQLSLHYDEIIYAYGFGALADQTFYMHDSFVPIRYMPFSLLTDVLQASDSKIPVESTNNALRLISNWKRLSAGNIAVLSVARPEKLCNPSFLGRLERLINSNSSSHFFWCGREDAPSTSLFQRALNQCKLEERCTFVGWVHPWPVIAASDYFLDTYPFGSGITIAQALRLNKKIIAHTPTRECWHNAESDLAAEPNYNQLLMSLNLSQTTFLTDTSTPSLECNADFNSTRLISANGYPCDPFLPTLGLARLMNKRLLGEPASSKA